jgi:hypothetical protein
MHEEGDSPELLRQADHDIKTRKQPELSMLVI